MNSRSRGSVAVSASLWLLVLPALVNCSSKTEMTCREYGALSFNEQGIAVDHVIEEHGLDPTSSSAGAAMVNVEIDEYCGIPLPGEPPSANLDGPIEDGVDWEIYSE